MKRIFSTALIACAALLSACTQIDTGNVGVERTLGSVKPDELPPGVYFTMFKTVDEFTTKEIAVVLNDMKPKARDNLTMADVDLDVYFKVNPTRMADLYIKYQGDVFKLPNGDMVPGYNRVLREAREASYRAFTEFDATTVHLKRTEVVERIRAMLQAELDKSDKDAFSITNVNARAMNTDPALEASIRLRAEVDQQIAAKQKEIELAKAEAARVVAQAEGTAKANHILAESLTPSLIRLKEIEAMAGFAAKGSSTVILQGGGATPLISVK